MKQTIFLKLVLGATLLAGCAQDGVIETSVAQTPDSISESTETTVAQTPDSISESTETTVETRLDIKALALLGQEWRITDWTGSTPDDVDALQQIAIGSATFVTGEEADELFLQIPCQNTWWEIEWALDSFVTVRETGSDRDVALTACEAGRDNIESLERIVISPGQTVITTLVDPATMHLEDANGEWFIDAQTRIAVSPTDTEPTNSSSTTTEPPTN